MIDFDYYRKVNGSYNKSTKTEYLKDKMVNSLNNFYKNVIPEFDILIASDRADDVLIDGKESRILINYNSDFTLSKLDDGLYSVQSKPNEIKVGSYIIKKNYTTDEKITYLVTEKGSERLNYENGYMRECNYILKWINKNGDIICMPCVTEETSSTRIGINASQTLITQQGELTLYLPFNTETQKIDIDERFIITNSGKKAAYKVVSFNDVPIKGLVKLIVSQEGAEVSEENDNIELEIADYKNKMATYSIYITNKTGITPMQVKQGDTLHLM
jgi:hypothetical protein